jgi:hypothetical protein
MSRLLEPRGAVFSWKKMGGGSGADFMVLRCFLRGVLGKMEDGGGVFVVGSWWNAW